jgi:coenzyme PQQ precursor peptide PqqA
MKWETPSYNDLRFGFEVFRYGAGQFPSPCKHLFHDDTL